MNYGLIGYIERHRYRIDEALKDHELATENFRAVIADQYPDATRSDHPYATIRSHMAAVLRSLEYLRRTLDAL